MLQPSPVQSVMIDKSQVGGTLRRGTNHRGEREMEVEVFHTISFTDDGEGGVM